jgi:magnesium-transporting ATPase (P-type)
MEFRMFSVAGDKYKHVIRSDMDFGVESYKDAQPAESIISEIADALSRHERLSAKHQQSFDFLEAIALCHECLPSTPFSNHPTSQGFGTLQRSKEDVQLCYQSSSPDEVALVSAARDMFFTFKNKVSNSVMLNILNASIPTQYTLLNVLEFSSDRKRMSTIYRYPNGRIILLCKGADSVIMERLKPRSNRPGSSSARIFDKTVEDLHSFALEGLRTLLYACRELTEEEYSVWAKQYEEASTAIQNRSEKLEQVAEIIECNLILLGATAVEDKLQAGVPETIDKLRRANVKVWMLTGDKTETAINIGGTCKLIRKDSTVMIIKAEDESHDSLKKSLDDSIALFRSIKLPPSGERPSNHMIVVVEGKTMMQIQQEKAKAVESSKSSKLDRLNGGSLLLDKFLDLSLACDSVICCRFSPAQKALIVSEVKTRLANQNRSENGASIILKELRNETNSLSDRLWRFLSLDPGTSGVTLAIGDGANDIPMMQSAHVGIGIAGREGLAASRSADYSIAKFRFLQPLLFVHGRWSYIRTSVFILGTFYKVFTIFLLHYLYFHKLLNFFTI